MFGWFKKKKRDTEMDAIASQYLKDKLGITDPEPPSNIDQLNETAAVFLDAWRYSVARHPTVPKIGQSDD